MKVLGMTYGRSLGLIFACFSSLVCSVYFSHVNHSCSLPCSFASVVLHRLAFLQRMDFPHLTGGAPVPSLGLRDLRDHFLQQVSESVPLPQVPMIYPTYLYLLDLSW